MRNNLKDYKESKKAKLVMKKPHGYFQRLYENMVTLCKREDVFNPVLNQDHTFVVEKFTSCK